jgi:tRNA(Ile2) C34 agmatinyltransferase TiaS
MKKFSNAIMIVLVILAIYFFYTETMPVRISVEKLITAYEQNSRRADDNFLNKEIEVAGTVKAFYEFENKHNLLELNSGNRDIRIYCIIVTADIDEKANKLIKDTPVTVVGKCQGLAKGIFPNSIYIEVKSIK